MQACQFRPLVQHADQLLGLSNKMLGQTITNFVVRKTFFNHFCAGKDPGVGNLSQDAIAPWSDPGTGAARLLCESIDTSGIVCATCSMGNKSLIQAIVAPGIAYAICWRHTQLAEHGGNLPTSG